MGKLRWYKRDPDAALGGMMALTLEERGAYNTVLDLIYSHADQLRDDDRFIAGWCGCDLRVWRRIKKRLIELGKLHLEGGFVRNFRATSGVDEALSRVASATEAANIKHAKSRAAASNNKGLTDAPADETHMQTTTTTTPTVSVVVDTRARRAVEGELAKAWPRLGTDMKSLSLFGTLGMVDGWLRGGADLDLDVLPTINRIAAGMAAKGQPPPNTLNYFAQPIADALAMRKQGLPNGHAANSHEARHANGAYRSRRPQGGRLTDGSVTGAVAFLTRSRGEDFDDQ